MIVKRYKQSDRDMNAVSGTRMLLGLNADLFIRAQSNTTHSKRHSICLK